MDLQPEKKPWYKQKTTRILIGLILGQAGGVLAGSIEVSAAINTSVMSIAGIFMRQGVENSK